MAQKTTIYDIAQRLNITAATVSRALNGNKRISESTRKLVLATAEEMNYKPNKLALALKQGKSNTVGVVVPYINRNFFSTVIRGIEEGLYENGYNVIICQTQDSEEREVQNIQNLINAQVEGIFISVSRSTKNMDHLKQVTAKGIPLVFFDRKVDLKGTSSVVIDDYQGSYEATKHLISQGCKRIGHMTVDRSVEIYENRYQGYKQALIDHSIPVDDALTVSLKSDIEEGKRAVEKLMNVPNPPDGIFSSSDPGALGAIQWLQEKGYDLPEDVCVVGFSNEPFTQFMELSISSVDQSPYEMGQIAAKVFLEHTDEKGNVKIEKKVILSPSLITRDSSTRIPVEEEVRNVVL